MGFIDQIRQARQEKQQERLRQLDKRMEDAKYALFCETQRGYILDEINELKYQKRALEHRGITSVPDIDRKLLELKQKEEFFEREAIKYSH